MKKLIAAIGLVLVLSACDASQWQPTINHPEPRRDCVHCLQPGG